MNENILELLKNQLTGPILGQIARSLGLSEDKARTGVEGAIATVLAGLLQKASGPGGTEGILKTIKDGGFSGDMLSNLGSVLGTPDGVDGLMKSGNSLLGGLLGNKLEGVANAFASSLGMPKGAASSLLALAAPLVMSQISKVASARGLNPAGLAELLMSQKPHLLSAAPQGLSSALGLSRLADIGTDAQREVAAYGSAAAQTGEATLASGVSWAKWALPVCLLAALLAAVGFFAMRPQEAVDQAARPAVPETATAVTEAARQEVAGAAEKVRETINSAAQGTRAAAADVEQEIAAAAKGTRQTVAGAAERTSAAAEGIKAKLAAITLPGGVKLDLPENSGLARFATFLGNPTPNTRQTFALESFQYDPGTTRASAAGLDSMDILARILKACSSVNIKLIGHPAAVGDSTQQQAEALRRASDARSLLVERGIDPIRIEVEAAETEAKGGNLELAVTKL